MKSRFALILFVLLPFLSGHQNGLHLKVAFRQNMLYRTSMVNISNETVNYKADKEIMNRLKSRGITLPIVTRRKQVIIIISRTAAVNRRGLIPFSGKVDSVSVIQFVNGQLQTENQPVLIDTSFRMSGFYIGDSVIVKNIEARNLNPTMRESMKSMLAQMMKSVKFPDSLLKVGDKFIQTVPLTIPLGQLGHIGMTITTKYTLKRIVSGQADFDISQKYDLASHTENVKFSASGEGEGRMVFDTKADFMTLMDTRSSITMETHTGPLEVILKSKDHSHVTTSIKKR